MNDVTKFATDFLTLSENVLFYYNCETNMLRLFWIINSDSVVDIANMDFDEWVDDVISGRKITENDIAIFKIFVNSVKYCTAKATYSFHTNILSPNNAFACCKVSFLPKEYEDSKYVIGEWLVIDEATGDYIENYTHGSYVDPLTGIFNKQSIINYAKERIEDPEAAQCALMLLNLDDFKQININHGRMFGDQILKAVAEVIRSVIGAHGVVGRFGGDEFMIALNDASDELIVRNYIRTIRANLTMLFPDVLGSDRITCSVGIAQSRINSNKYDELFKIVERVLYIAKQKGKDRYVIYRPEMHGQIITGNINSAYDDDGKAHTGTDWHKSAKLMLKLAADGVEMLPRFLEQLSRALSVDRIVIFWGKDYELISTSHPELYRTEIYPRVLEDKDYLDHFSDDMICIEDIESIRESLPDAYGFFKELGISNTMQHLLRDRDGHVTGIIVAYEYQDDRQFLQGAAQTFSFVCKVINGILLKQ